MVSTGTNEEWLQTTQPTCGGAVTVVWQTALRIATGYHKMSSIDHLHKEAEMLKVREHSELLSAQYLARYMEPGNVCHPITTRDTPEMQMKETLYTRHQNTVEPMMVKNDSYTQSTPH